MGSPMDNKNLDHPQTAETSTVNNDWPLVQQRLHHGYPKPHQDIALQSLAILSLSCPQATSWVAIDSSGPLQQSPDYASPVRQVQNSTPNTFGLFWKYYLTCFLNNDSSNNVLFKDLIDKLLDLSPMSPSPYYPDPNQLSFLLGQWYWNNSKKKLQSSFQKLLKIVEHLDFHPEDVAGNNWQLIGVQLSGKQCEGSNKENGWEDNQNGGFGGWIKISIKINVSFHKWALHPGQKVFDVGIFYHCKLTSVIRERITQPSMHFHLHIKPYKFFWQLSDTAEPVQVCGELYTLKMFIKTHSKLQNSSWEPGCNLLRVVLGLMFVSNDT